MNNSKGLLIILSGPSGAGKDTVLKELLAHNDKVRVSISATTRQPRQGEENGRDYHFISREQFETLIQRDGVLEYAEYCGNFYGTPRAQVEAWLDEGLECGAGIEVQGAKKVMAKCPGAVSVFICRRRSRCWKKGCGEEARTLRKPFKSGWPPQGRDPPVPGGLGLCGSGGGGAPPPPPAGGAAGYPGLPPLPG